MQGFTVGNYSSRFGDWLLDGKLKYEETVTEALAFENTIDAFLDLFKGANLGKAIVKVTVSDK